MRLTPDLLTFSPTPTAQQVDAEWYHAVVRKRETRRLLLQPWATCSPEQLHEIAATRYHVRDVPVQSSLLSADEQIITDTSPRKLLDQIANATWTAEDVLRAYIRRAVIAQELTNALSEIMFEEGLQYARKLDQHLRETGKTIGPLHGLPLSIKDTFDVEGFDSAMGWAALIEKPKSTTARLIQKLQGAGAIIYCKTCVPQSLMSGECVSYVYGRTSSPCNTTLSAGGSSGGEGALVSLGGSAIGIGTDIAGSVRTPANFCGVYTVCPTYGRIPLAEKTGMDAIRAVHGPLSRSVEGLEVYFRALLGLNPWEWDISTVPMPWREEEYEEGLGKKRPLVFGLMRHDGVVRPHPPIERAIAHVEKCLKAAGHTVVEFAPVKTAELMKVAFAIFGSTGGQDVWSLQKMLNEPLIGEISPATPNEALSASDYFALNFRKSQLQREFHDAWYKTATAQTNHLPIDALIMPSGGHVACPHGSMTYFAYEAISNVLDLPCATVPVDYVRPDVDVDLPSFTPMSSYDSENWTKYDPQAYAYGPISLQVMGLRFGEEKLIGTLRAVDRALGRVENFQI